MSYLATALLIGLLIFVHELGHLLTAWCVGIRVARFSLGFGPVLLTRRVRGVEYCLSLVPLGGYVLPAFEDEADFAAIPAGRRIALWLGGPMANFLFAALLLAVVNSATAGFSWCGVLVEPWRVVAWQSGQILAALGGIALHPDHLSGIIGIVAVGKSVVAAGWTNALRFAVLLNVNLAIFNLLPIAPLDGGKVLFALLEKFSPRLARLQVPVAVAGLGFLLLLMVYTTLLDITRQLA